ncbi:MAG: histidinol-phosphate transaminase [Halobacteria archaeon]|nr:histidinol-phosphate transaminase [Halobacteria archaeon]
MKDILRDLSDHDEYVPGKGAEEVARERGFSPGEMVKLASNENPFGPPPVAVDALKEKAEEASVYPTALHSDVREEIADYVDSPVENVVLGAGADGVFDTVGRAVIDEGDAVLTPSPGFSYYGMSARNQGGSERSYALDKEDGFEITAEGIIDSYDGEKIVYITTPNNPTGTALGTEDIRDVAESLTDALVFVDEAYGEFSEHASAVDIALELDNLAVSRTFSKAFGLAGLRVGYAVVPDWLADAYSKVVTPFAVGTLSLHAASAALEDEEHLEKSVENARWGREYMRREIDARVFDSEANFVLVDVSPRTGTEVADALEERGFIVRDTTSFGLPNCVRVTVGTRRQTREVVKSLNDVLEGEHG